MTSAGFRLRPFPRSRSDSFLLPQYKSNSAISVDQAHTSGGVNAAEVYLTTEDVSSLLSRIAQLEADLNGAMMPSTKKSSLDAAHASFVGIEPDTENAHTHLCQCDAHRYSCTILSLPFVRSLLRKLAETDVESEECIVQAIRRLVHEQSGPWSQLCPCIPVAPICGPRTSEHYLSVINVAVKARKQMRDSRKQAKFWKSAALAFVAGTRDASKVNGMITPSSSDISNTGLEEVLSEERKERLELLKKKRQYTANNSDKSNTHTAIQCTSSASELANRQSDPSSSDCLSETSSYKTDEGETTLVSEQTSVICSPKLPAVLKAVEKLEKYSASKRSHKDRDQTRSESCEIRDIPGRAGLPKRSPSGSPSPFRRPSTSSISKLSSIPYATVKTKRQMFENPKSTLSEPCKKQTGLTKNTRVTPMTPQTATKSNVKLVSPRKLVKKTGFSAPSSLPMLKQPKSPTLAHSSPLSPNHVNRPCANGAQLKDHLRR